MIFLQSTIGQKLQDLLINQGLSSKFAFALSIIVLVMSIFIIAILADYITRKIIVNSLMRLAQRSKTKWDDYLFKNKVIKRLSHIIPGIIIILFIDNGILNYPALSSFIVSVTNIYLIFISLITIDAMLDSLLEMYQTLPVSNDRPIKGYVQSVKLILYFVGIILILSIILDKSPSKLFASLGAIAAILILVFKDTLLGFVSSIQLSANKMVKPGDWISMPARNTDGVVLEITLNTVKIQNWDKTISTIPTYALTSESFQNWKGMEESKGRRIARSIYIDIKTIKFCDYEMLERFEKFRLIRDYVNEKQAEIEKFNKEQGIDDNDVVSRRSLSNVGIFRQYVQTYLENHPDIHENINPYIVMVRHLQPTERGLPIQIYAFCKKQEWTKYEQVQADIFDHILAVAPEFGLSIFQNPSGDDFKSIISIAK